MAKEYNVLPMDQIVFTFNASGGWSYHLAPKGGGLVVNQEHHPTLDAAVQAAKERYGIVEADAPA